MADLELLLKLIVDAEQAKRELGDLPKAVDKSTDDIRRQFGVSSDIIRRDTTEAFTAITRAATNLTPEIVKPMTAAERAARSAVAGTLKASLEVLNNANDSIKGVTTKAAEQSAAQIRGLSAYTSSLIAESQRAITTAQNISRGADDAIERLGGRLAKAKAEASSLATGFSSAIGPITAVAAGIATVVTGAVALGAALFRLTKGVAENASEIVNLSQKTNFTVGSVSALSIGAKLAGVEINSVSTSLTNFNKNLEEVAQGNKKVSATFNALKIDVSDQEKALSSAFKVLSQMPAGYQQTALAQKLFGESGEDMLAIIKKAGGNFETFKQHLRETGELLSEKDAIAAKQFTESLKTLESQAASVANLFVQQFMPLITNAMGEISTSLRENKELWSSWGQSVGDFLRGVRSIAESEVGTIIGLIARLNLEFTGIPGLLRSIAAFGGRSPEEKKADADSAARDTAFERMYSAYQDKLRREGAKNRVNIPSGGRKGGGEDKGRREQIALLEAEQKEAQRIYRNGTEAIKREFDLREIGDREHTDKLIAAAQKRFEVFRDSINQQKALAKTAAERRKFDDDLVAAQDERDRERQKAEDEQGKREIETKKAKYDTLLNIAEQYDKRNTEIIRRMAENRAITQEEAEKRLGEIEVAALTREHQRVLDERELFNQRTAEYQKLTYKLGELEIQRAILIEQVQVRIEEARQEDLEREREYFSELFKLQKEYEQNERELERQRFQRLLKTPGQKPFAIGRIAEIDINTAEAEHKRRLESLRLEEEDQIRSVKGLEDFEKKKLSIQQQYNALRLQEEERFKNERDEILRQSDAALERLNPISGRSLFGDVFADTVNETGSQLQGFAAMAGDIFRQLSEQAGNFGTIIASVFSQVGEAVGSVVKTFVLFGGAGTSFRKFAAEVISSIAQMAAVKAVWEVAEGLAAVARAIFGDPKAAAEAKMHFAAALKYGLVAGIAAGAGRAVAGNLFSGEHGSGAGAGGGQGGHAEPREQRFNYGNNTFPSSQVAGTGSRNIADALNNVAAQLSRIKSMPQGDALALGVAQNPGAVGDGLSAALDNSHPIGREFYEKSGFR
jgi:hypothetical protein